MKRKVELLLLDAVSACRSVSGFIVGKGYDDYLADELLRSGVQWNLAVAGEALNQALAEDETLAESIPQLHAIVGLRNRLIHGYHGIDNSIVWIIATERVPELTRHLEIMLLDEIRRSGAFNEAP